MKKLSPVIIELLKNRGIESETDMLEFLAEKPQKTYDPFLLYNMEEGVDLILSAVNENKRICIFGDYDADGVTSVSLMYKILSLLTDNLMYYIPSRFGEGYGLNRIALERIGKQGAEFIITVDCGSVAYEEVKYAKELGMDIVITDHHSIGEGTLDCLMINPKQKECTYPFKELAGVGVAFKVAQAICQKTGIPKTEINKIVELVAIGTVADVVPLIDENRTIVKYGTKMLNGRGNIGIETLIDRISLKKGNISSENIAFIIAPHLNAVGRMNHAGTAVELILTEDEGTIEEKIKVLIDSNNRRKALQEETYQKCIDFLEKEEKPDRIILMDAQDAHEGITGIVAGKLKDRYNLPTVILTPLDSQKDYLKATGRSIEKINLYELLKTCSDMFERFGGHKGACGFTMKRENLHEVRRRLAETLECMEGRDGELFVTAKNIDMILPAEYMTVEFAEELELLAPFGSGNTKPIFEIVNLRFKNVEYIGKGGQHARFSAVSPDGKTIDCILFNKAGKYEKEIYSSESKSIIGTIECQEWRGKKKVQFVVSCITCRV